MRASPSTAMRTVTKITMAASSGARPLTRHRRGSSNRRQPSRHACNQRADFWTGTGLLAVVTRRSKPNLIDRVLVRTGAATSSRGSPMSLLNAQAKRGGQPSRSRLSERAPLRSRPGDARGSASREAPYKSSRTMTWTPTPISPASLQDATAKDSHDERLPSVASQRRRCRRLLPRVTAATRN